MVHGHEALFLVAPLEHGEVHNPETCELILVAETELTSHLQAQLTKLLACAHYVVAAHNQDKVAGFGVHSFFELLEYFL